MAVVKYCLVVVSATLLSCQSELLPADRCFERHNFKGQHDKNHPLHERVVKLAEENFNLILSKRRLAVEVPRLCPNLQHSAQT